MKKILFSFLVLFLFLGGLNAALSRKLSRRKEVSARKNKRRPVDLLNEQAVQIDKEYLKKLLEDLKNREREEEAIALAQEYCNSQDPGLRLYSILVYKTLVKREPFEQDYLYDSLEVLKKTVFDENEKVLSAAKKLFKIIVKERLEINSFLDYLLKQIDFEESYIEPKTKILILLDICRSPIINKELTDFVGKILKIAFKSDSMQVRYSAQEVLELLLNSDEGRCIISEIISAQVDDMNFFMDNMKLFLRAVQRGFDRGMQTGVFDKLTVFEQSIVQLNRKIDSASNQRKDTGRGPAFNRRPQGSFF
ncbi:MAG: hypothetical protein ABIF12_03815 [bacterium]